MTDTKTAPTVAQELKAAAAKVREMAASTSRGPWFVGDCEMYPRWILSEGERDEHGYNSDVARVDEDEADSFAISDANWEWMGFAHPGLAEPLAALLDHLADIAKYAADRGLRNAAAGQVEHALAVARAINGTAPQEVSSRG